MKTIQRIETFDGEIHPTVRDAEKHLDELLGALLTPMARTLAQVHKFADVLAYLESHTETMRQIVQIRDDRRLEEFEEA